MEVSGTVEDWRAGGGMGEVELRVQEAAISVYTHFSNCAYEDIRVLKLVFSLAIKTKASDLQFWV